MSIFKQAYSNVANIVQARISRPIGPAITACPRAIKNPVTDNIHNVVESVIWNQIWAPILSEIWHCDEFRTR